MRQEKLTTKLQEALSDAQSLAVGNDNQYIEPVTIALDVEAGRLVFTKPNLEALADVAAG